MNTFFFQQIFKEGIVLINKEKEQKSFSSILHPISTPNLFLFKSKQNTQEEILLNKIISTCTDKGKEIKTLTTEANFSLLDLNKNKNIKNVFLFDHTSTDIGIDFKERKYVPYDFGKIFVIFSDNLSILNTTNEAKKSLWNIMQKILKL